MSEEKEERHESPAGDMPPIELCFGFSCGPFRFEARVFPTQIYDRWREASKHDALGATIGALCELDRQVTGARN